MAKPIIVKHGPATVRIRLDVPSGRGCAYTYHILDWNQNGKRHRRTFTNLEDAKTEARRVAAMIANGHARAAEIPPSELMAYAMASEELAAFQITPAQALQEYLHCRRVLGPGQTLLEAVVKAKDESERTRDRKLGEVIQAFIKHKAEQAKLGQITDRHFKDTKGRIQRIGLDPERPIGSIQRADLQALLNREDWGPTTRKNYRASLTDLWSFARDEGMIPPMFRTPAELLPVPVNHARIRDFFSVADMTRIMTCATGDIQLYLAIGAFLGVRPDETLRLDWSMFRLHDNVLMLPQMRHANDRTTKTGKPRSVPIPANLLPLLQWHAKPSGRLFPVASIQRASRDFVKGLGITWSHDILRKSAATYLLAKTQNAGQVATWLGNSDDILKDRYIDNELASEAEKWFSISIPIVPTTAAA